VFVLVVICRWKSLKLEKKLSRNGIPLFATDEPAHIDGVNATTVLVRRMKQGVAEWFRLQLKEKTWKGLVGHSLDGWNIGTAPVDHLFEPCIRGVVTHNNEKTLLHVGGDGEVEQVRLAGGQIGPVAVELEDGHGGGGEPPLRRRGRAGRVRRFG
jgi:hypothetical protein